MSLAIYNDYQLKQMDIKTAYLNAPIEEMSSLNNLKVLNFWIKMENHLFVK